MATGFGTDVWCRESLRPGRLVFGVELVAHALYRRLSTPRGMLRGGEQERNYGIDLEAYSGALGDDAAAALPTIAANECLKDDRVASCVARSSRVVAADRTESLEIAIDVFTTDPDVSFTLTVAISAGVLQLVGVTTLG